MSEDGCGSPGGRRWGFALALGWLHLETSPPGGSGSCFGQDSGGRGRGWGVPWSQPEQGLAVAPDSRCSKENRVNENLKSFTIEIKIKKGREAILIKKTCFLPQNSFLISFPPISPLPVDAAGRVVCDSQMSLSAPSTVCARPSSKPDFILSRLYPSRSQATCPQERCLSGVTVSVSWRTPGSEAAARDPATRSWWTSR